MDHSPVGERLDHPPVGERLDHPPVGERLDHPPVGERHATLFSGYAVSTIVVVVRYLP